MKKKFISAGLCATLVASLFAGCGANGGATSTETVETSGELTWRIGGIGPITGGAAQYGQGVMNAIQIAVDEINEAGGINGYKISAPTVYARSSERELLQLIRGFGFDPVMVDGTNNEEFQIALANLTPTTFIIMKTPKGYTGPKEVDGLKIEGNCAAHQVPLPKAKTDERQLRMLEDWLKSYNFKELYHEFTHDN